MIKSSKVKQGKQDKAYTFGLIVANSNIAHQLTKIVSYCRFAWNKALSLVKQDDENYLILLEISKMNGGDGKGISQLFKFNPYHQLTTWKQQSNTAFFKQVYSKSL
ncbi:MAG: hypothetical protein RLZZ293_484 [Pseudomonadota bacterium]